MKKKTKVVKRAGPEPGNGPETVEVGVDRDLPRRRDAGSERLPEARCLVDGDVHAAFLDFGVSLPGNPFSFGHGRSGLLILDRPSLIYPTFIVR